MKSNVLGSLTEIECKGTARLPARCRAAWALRVTLSMPLVQLHVEVTPRFLDTSGSYFGLEFPPGHGRYVAES